MLESPIALEVPRNDFSIFVVWHLQLVLRDTSDVGLVELLVSDICSLLCLLSRNMWCNLCASTRTTVGWGCLELHAFFISVLSPKLNSLVQQRIMMGVDNGVHLCIYIYELSLDILHEILERPFVHYFSRHGDFNFKLILYKVWSWTKYFKCRNSFREILIYVLIYIKLTISSYFCINIE